MQDKSIKQVNAIFNFEQNIHDLFFRISDPRKLTTKRQPTSDEFEDNEGPIKYSTSKAAKHKASVSRHGLFSNRLEYEPEVIIASLAVFLIYFTMIREENDIDEELGKSLYSRIDGLEELQLKLSLRYNTEHNKSIDDIEKRLRQIEKEKQQRASAQADIHVE